MQPAVVAEGSLDQGKVCSDTNPVGEDTYDSSCEESPLSDDDEELARLTGYADFLDWRPGQGHLQPQGKLLEQHQRLVDLGDRLVARSDRRTKDKADRATTDNCLDQRTLRILFKLIQQGVLATIEGCISAGKEANVYYADSPEFGHLAIKVYMTSVMPFKNRDKYMTGDRRLRHGIGKRSWKKVGKWAEKEFRNLLRVAQSGIPAPTPIKLKGVVLLMSLVGESADAPAPKLKDVVSDDAELWRRLYWQVVDNLRTLYQQCRLVHGDLSEYNLLYCAGQVVWIDFSQSVEHEHPQTFAFLRADCRNVNAFFCRKPVRVLADEELFEFVTDPTITADNCQRCLQALQAVADEREQPPDVDGAFQGVHIPRRLEEVLHYERNALLLRQGKMTQHDLLFATVTGLSHDLTGPKRTPALLEAEVDHPLDRSCVADEESASAASSSDEESVGDADDHDVGEAGSKTPTQKRPANETAEERRLRKQAVRAGRREKQKTKVPKHEKKRQAKAKKK